MPRYEWTDAELAAKLDHMINDPAMKAKLQAASKHMQSQNGPKKAAAILDQLVQTGAYHG
jgi:UDP:flavonoid glycosyltransferase YjiC (YdhE family)